MRFGNNVIPQIETPSNIFIFIHLLKKVVSMGKREYFFSPEYLKMIIRVYMLLPVIPTYNFTISCRQLFRKCVWVWELYETNEKYAIVTPTLGMLLYKIELVDDKLFMFG